MEGHEAPPIFGLFIAPLVVLAVDFEPRALRLLKRLKVRGSPLLAVCLGQREQSIDIAGDVIYELGALRLIKPLPKLNVVSGLRKSVLANQSPRKILLQHPELIGSLGEIDSHEEI